MPEETSTSSWWHTGNLLKHSRLTHISRNPLPRPSRNTMQPSNGPSVACQYFPCVPLSFDHTATSSMFSPLQVNQSSGKVVCPLLICIR